MTRCWEATHGNAEIPKKCRPTWGQITAAGRASAQQKLDGKKLQGEANSGIQSNKGRHPQIDPETEREA